MKLIRARICAKEGAAETASDCRKGKVLTLISAVLSRRSAAVGAVMLGALGLSTPARAEDCDCYGAVSYYEWQCGFDSDGHNWKKVEVGRQVYQCDPVADPPLQGRRTNCWVKRLEGCHDSCISCEEREHCPLPAPASGCGFGTDILSRKSDGTLAIWFMDGARKIRGVNPVYWSGYPPANDWQIAGTGDFSGDAKTDILWRQTGGAIAVWSMSGGALIADTYPVYWSGYPPANDWQIKGVGRFDSDAVSDILWRHTSGTVAIWLIRDGVLAGDTYPGTRTNDWQIRGVADFNGDNTSDILWRNNNGTLGVWLMNQGVKTADASPGAPGNDWQIAGTGDFDGNGKGDILWRHTNGTVAIWFMNGIAKAGEGYPGALGADWTIRDVGDFNSDGKSDILWSKTDGTLKMWFMNGATKAAEGNPGALGTDWTIQDAAQFDRPRR